MKKKKVQSRYTNHWLTGTDAECYVILEGLRAGEKKAVETRKAMVAEKAITIKRAAELKAADEYEMASKRKQAAAKYKADTRGEAREYGRMLEDRAHRVFSRQHKKSTGAAERKVEEILLEALGEQAGPDCDFAVYLRTIRDTLDRRLWKMMGHL